MPTPETFPLLTDSQLWSSWLTRPGIPDGEDDSMETQIVGYARAVESATRSPLLAKIAKLEAENKQLCEQHEAQAAEFVALKTERDELTDVLHRGGFVSCDIAACNCGSWHARFGWPERFREFTEALEEHGAKLHSGKTALAILREMLAERDAAIAKVADLGADRDSWVQQASDRTDDAVRFAAERDAVRAALTHIANLEHENSDWLRAYANNALAPFEGEAK